MENNAIAETYDPVTLFGKPALFTPLRIDRKTVQEGLFAYDIRHSDDDGNAVTVEKKCPGRPYGHGHFFRISGFWGSGISSA